MEYYWPRWTKKCLHFRVVGLATHFSAADSEKKWKKKHIRTINWLTYTQAQKHYTYTLFIRVIINKSSFSFERFACRHSTEKAAIFSFSKLLKTHLWHLKAFIFDLFPLPVQKRTQKFPKGKTAWVLNSSPKSGNYVEKLKSFSIQSFFGLRSLPPMRSS